MTDRAAFKYPNPTPWQVQPFGKTGHVVRDAVGVQVGPQFSTRQHALEWAFLRVVERADVPTPRNADFVTARLAFEAGYRAAEKGQNMDAAWRAIMGLETVETRVDMVAQMDAMVTAVEAAPVVVHREQTPSGWVAKPYQAKRLEGHDLARFDRADGMYRVEENQHTFANARPFYVLRSYNGGRSYISTAGFSRRFATAEAAMAAVDKKEPRA